MAKKIEQRMVVKMASFGKPSSIQIMQSTQHFAITVISGLLQMEATALGSNSGRDRYDNRSCLLGSLIGIYQIWDHHPFKTPRA